MLSDFFLTKWHCPRRGDFILRYALALFCPRLRGKSGAAGKGEASAASQSVESSSCHMTQKSKSRNVLASPLGEEDHEVAKGCTRVRMIMTLDMDVTAAGVSKGEAAFFYMTVCCSPTPSSRAEMHVGMGQMENALMIL